MKKLMIGVIAALMLTTAAQAAWQCKANVNGTRFGWNGYVFVGNHDARKSAIELCNFRSGRFCHIQNCWEVW